MAVLRRLFTPIRIGNMELKNRIVMSPMTTDFDVPDANVSRRLLDYYETRAKGGPALITVEACTVDPNHLYRFISIGLTDDSLIPKHRQLADLIHAYGAKAQPQILHPGPEAMTPFLTEQPGVGPSVVRTASTKQVCRELSVEEIEGLVELHGEAARRAREAGYDGIELHAAHSYSLIGSFLSPLRNYRTDEYTGETIQGRTKLLIEVIRKVKEKAGNDFPITLRISGFEREPGGREIHDTQRIAPMLVQAGVDAFAISGGVIDTWAAQIVPGCDYPDCLNVAAAVSVRNVVDVPVMVVGRIHDPVVAERILENNQADLIMMGRPLLADPELPAKAQSGKLRDIRKCISCQNCVDCMMVEEDLNCSVNGFLGREGEYHLKRTDKAKKVMVIGGGPAGLEAARIAAIRGHRVTLYEKQRSLGGALILASAVHSDNESFLDYLITQVKQLPMDIRLGEMVTPARVMALKPDVVLVATGARVVAPEIPGFRLPHVFTGPQMRRLMAGAPDREDMDKLPGWQRAGLQIFGRRLPSFLTPSKIREYANYWLPFGKTVAILGADLATTELAEFLAERGRQVSLLEEGETIAPEILGKRRAVHAARLDRLGVTVNTGVEFEEITKEGVRIKSNTGLGRLIRADTVILAGRVEPDMGLFKAVENEVPEAFAIGDCTGLGLITKAVADATLVSCSL